MKFFVFLLLIIFTFQEVLFLSHTHEYGKLYFNCVLCSLKLNQNKKIEHKVELKQINFVEFHSLFPLKPQKILYYFIKSPLPRAPPLLSLIS